MFHLKEIKPMEGATLWLRYEDGVEGKVDLSALTSQGVFASLSDPQKFKNVHVGEYGQVAWDNDMEICADSLYFRLSKKTPETVFHQHTAHA